MKVVDSRLNDGTPWRLFVPDGAHGGWAVLWLQGFTSTIRGHSEGCERMSAASRVPFAILDYAGHGDHPIALAEATRNQQFEEVCAVYDELVKLGLDKIIVIGGSFGGYMAALLAGARKPRVIVLRAPANYNDEEFSNPYSETIEFRFGEAKDLYGKSIDISYSNRATKALHAFDGESFIIEHGADTLINAAIPRSYFHAAKYGNYITIPGLEHSPKLMPKAADWYGVIENWIQAIIYSSLHSADNTR